MGKLDKLYDGGPRAPEEQRKAVKDFYDFRYPHLRQMENLQKELALVRGEAIELERRGMRSREWANLKGDALKLWQEIERLSGAQELADGPQQSPGEAGSQPGPSPSPEYDTHGRSTSTKL
jgi:hypothetical protein